MVKQLEAKADVMNVPVAGRIFLDNGIDFD
jgi:hypothetical protein